jgi:hypothetical protein
VRTFAPFAEAASPKTLAMVAVLPVFLGLPLMISTFILLILPEVLPSEE